MYNLHLSYTAPPYTLHPYYTLSQHTPYLPDTPVPHTRSIIHTLDPLHHTQSIIQPTITHLPYVSLFEHSFYRLHILCITTPSQLPTPLRPRSPHSMYYTLSDLHILCIINSLCLKLHLLYTPSTMHSTSSIHSTYHVHSSCEYAFLSR